MNKKYFQTNIKEYEYYSLDGYWYFGEVGKKWVIKTRFYSAIIQALDFSKFYDNREL